MSKKRVIFTLFYSGGYFMLSRNFRLQKAGDVRWLLRNYRFGDMSAFIDELMIVDVTRGALDRSRFMDDVRQIVTGCFVPVSLGGSIDSIDVAKFFISNGADKIVINSLFDTDPDSIRRIADTFGEQCVVAGIDLRRDAAGNYIPYSQQGSVALSISPHDRVNAMLDAGAGEILLQSIDKDGTGQGFDTGMIDALDSALRVPLILCGGCGKGAHMLQALQRKDVDAIATANLFNFIGDGLQAARSELFTGGLDLARWDASKVKSLHHALGSRP